MEPKHDNKVGRPRDDGLAARRKAEILETAAKLFAKRGYSKTDVQELADRLRVGKGTVYRYFPSKQALFFAAADWGIKWVMEQVDRDTRNIQDPLEKIEAGIYSYLSFFDEHPEFAELLIQERAEFRDRKKPTYFEYQEEGMRPWRKLTDNLIREGRYRNLPVDQILDVTGNLLYGTMFTNFFEGRKKSCRQQAREILDLVFFGLLSETERKRLSRIEPAPVE